MYLFIIMRVCARVCMGKCAYGSEGTLWSRFPLPFSEFLGCQATNVHRYLKSRLTCAGMFLLIRGLIVIFKINDALMG